MMTEKTKNVLNWLFVILMIIVITVFLRGGVYYFFGEKEEGEGGIVARLFTQHPVSQPWRPDATLVTVETPIPIQGIVPFANECQIGEVVAKIEKGDGQGAYFKTLVIPFREIPKGSRIQVEQISYDESSNHRASFLIVK